MHFANPSAGNDFANVVLANATARHYGDTTASLFDEPRDRCHSFDRGYRAAGGENAANARANQHFKRLPEIRGSVESAVKTHG